ncbi:MAG: leucyl/phenylalanyl-tRNA--protein transferase [Sandaracinobacteroides sp.]
MGGLDTHVSSSLSKRLETSLLIRAYSAGLFPMADTREADDIFWVEPRRRGILPLGDFHLPRSLGKILKQERFFHSTDLAFPAVIAACAQEAPGRRQSWINATIEDAYSRLHAEGHAHSIETWDREGRLVGGLYGVRLGAAFFGESMFSRANDASKAALAHLIARLRTGGFTLLDTQFLTDHLARFGGQEVKRTHYLALLDKAVRASADWRQLDRIEGVRPQPLGGTGSGPGVADLPAGFPFLPTTAGGWGPSGKRIVQLLSHTS